MSGAFDIRRQVQQRLDSLRQAGIEFVPRATLAVTTPPTAESPPTPIVSASPSPAATLFQSAPQTAATSADQRRVELKQLAEKVAKCTRCSELVSSRTQ